MASLADMGAGRNLVDKELPLPALKETIELTQSPLARITNRRVLFVEEIRPLFTGIGGLQVRFRFGIVDNLPNLVLLEAIFVDLYIKGTLPSE